MKKTFITIITFIIFITVIFPQPARAQTPSAWQTSATSLKISSNPSDQKTAGLSIHVADKAWPFLSVQGGVRSNETSSFKVAGPIGAGLYQGVDLGFVKIPGSVSSVLTSEVADWSGNEMTFTTSAGALKVWISRLTSSVLLEVNTSSLRLFSGSVKRYKIDNSQFTPKIVSDADGPSYPKYVAYSTGGNIVIQALSGSSTSLPVLDQGWMLVWYGNNSHFFDSKRPAAFVHSYAGLEMGMDAKAGVDAYPADVPVLLKFQNAPASISQSTEGGIDLTFTSNAGNVTMLPLFGREHKKASETDGWSGGLPQEVKDKINFWVPRSCDFPRSVSETYGYDNASDTANITENVSFINIGCTGTKFAPIPPMLALAKDALPVNFSGPLVNGNLHTDFGPTFGIENTDSYTWSVSGLNQYVSYQRPVQNQGEPPDVVKNALNLEVDKLIPDKANCSNNPHLAPWFPSAKLPVNIDIGDIYFLSPADTIYILSEVIPVLPEPQKSCLLTYLKKERNAYPPESVFNLPLSTGKLRGAFEAFNYGSTLTSQRPELFWTRVPLFNFYSLSLYYDLPGIGESVSSAVVSAGKTALDNDMAEQDFATMYWFRNKDERRTAMENVNRHFAGLLGLTRLANKTGDSATENLTRVLLAKAAVARVGMIKFPRYLYEANQIDLPANPAWHAKFCCLYESVLFNYKWTEKMDDARVVVDLDQFRLILHDNPGYRLPGSPFAGFQTGSTYAYMIPFRDIVPETAKFLKDKVKDETLIQFNKYEALLPHWFTTISDSVFGSEHGFAYPSDSYEMFLSKAWLQDEAPHNLFKFTDISWLTGGGDLFYLQKLAETIRAYKATANPVPLPVVVQPGGVAPTSTPIPSGIVSPTSNQSPTPVPTVAMPSPTPSSTPTLINTRRINAPYFAGNIDGSKAAIAWFGFLNTSQNFTDVRVGYNDTELAIKLSITDHDLWYDNTPSAADLNSWDATSLYVNLAGNLGNAPAAGAHRFVAQLNWFEPRTNFQTSYISNGSDWVVSNTSFTTETFWRGGAPNNTTSDAGWVVTYHIPFSSLGLKEPPQPGTVWGLALSTHDRDSLAGPPKSDKHWPEDTTDTSKPSTWGQLRFGIPAYTQPATINNQNITVRQGLNGQIVNDGMVGGGSTCGKNNPDPSGTSWDPWAGAYWDDNFLGYEQFNIQNELDVSDSNCFSKYFTNFPLTGIPAGKAIVSATLTLYQFGNAGGGTFTPPPPTTLVQVLQIDQNWDKSTITWNSAPKAMQNMPGGLVEPLQTFPGWPGTSRALDVTKFVADAYKVGKPLNIALYSADLGYHSGKYFVSSQAADWNAAGRPALNVVFGDPTSVTPTPAPTPCTITSASWDSVAVTEGMNVKLIITATPECNGKQVAFKVIENDSLIEGLIDEDAKIQPGSAVISNGTAQVTWIAEWSNDCAGLCLPPEYFFNVAVGNSSSVFRSSDPLLQVTKSSFNIIDGPLVQAAANSATITWTTSAVSSSKIEYGLTDQYIGSTSEINALSGVTEHSVTINNLNGCTKYRFIVRSRDSASNIVAKKGEFATKGCLGDSNIVSDISAFIASSSGGFLNLISSDSQKIGLTIPTLYTSSDAYFQISKLEANKVINVQAIPAGTKTAGNHIYKLSALTGAFNVLNTFNSSLTLTISYNDSDIAGIDPSTLKIYRFNLISGNWQQLTDCIVSTTAKIVTCKTTEF